MKVGSPTTWLEDLNNCVYFIVSPLLNLLNTEDNSGGDHKLYHTNADRPRRYSNQWIEKAYADHST